MNMVTEFKRVDVVEHLVSLADGEGGVEELHPLLLLTIKLKEDLRAQKISTFMGDIKCKSDRWW